MKKNRILIAAATTGEIMPLAKQIRSRRVEYCITGVGMLNTALNLSRYIQGREDILIAIQAGIGGSFSHKFGPGSVVQIKSEAYGDTGIETFRSFKTLEETGWETQNQYRNTLKHPLVQHLPSVSSITVAMACGTKKTADFRREKFNAVIENMEGLAFFRTCRMYHIPFLEIRSVSNFCGPHREGQWDIRTAITRLADHLAPVIKNMEDEM